MNTKTYDCGLRLIHEQNSTIKAVAVKIYCLAGGRDEDDSNRGIAHLLEHMFFKGTNKRTSREINLTFDRLGVMINAFTANDLTSYHTEGLVEHLDTMIEVMADCLYNSTYPKEELDKEKTVVCSELQMYENEYADVAQTNGLIVALQGTGYDYVLGGTVESVSKIESKDLIAFRDKWYTPNRIVVSVCGDVDFEKVDSLVQKWLIPQGAIHSLPITFCRENMDIDIKKRYLFESKQTDQVYGVINYRSINKSHKDVVAYNLGRLALGSTASSRLFTKLREEHGLVYVISANPTLFGDCGVNSVTFIASEKNASKAMELIKQTIDEVKKDGFTQEELDAYKNIYKSTLVLYSQSISSKAAKNAEAIIYTENNFDVEAKFSEIDAVTLDDMNRVFREFYDSKYLTIALVAKEDKIDALQIFCEE